MKYAMPMIKKLSLHSFSIIASLLFTHPSFPFLILFFRPRLLGLSSSRLLGPSCPRSLRYPAIDLLLPLPSFVFSYVLAFLYTPTSTNRPSSFAHYLSLYPSWRSLPPSPCESSSEVSHGVGGNVRSESVRQESVAVGSERLERNGTKI